MILLLILSLALTDWDLLLLWISSLIIATGHIMRDGGHGSICLEPGKAMISGLEIG